MSEKDDEFLDHAGEEFTPDNDDFEIPEDPHGDFLNDDESDFELTEDDVVDESGESDFMVGDADADADEIDLDEPDQAGDGGDAPGYGEEDYDDAYQGDASLGWKVWTGLALAAVLSAGGIFYFASTALGATEQAQQTSQSLPPPPSLPPAAPDSNQQANAQAYQQQVTPPPIPQNNQRRENAPVSVSPFPESGSQVNVAAQNQSAPTPPPANYANQMASGNAGGNQPPTPSAPSGGGDNSNGGIAQSFTLDEPERKQSGSVVGAPNTASYSGSAIAPPATSNRSDREPEYMLALSEQRKAFAALMSISQDNGNQLETVRSELDGYQKKTQSDVAGLDKRVERLESMIKEGVNVKQHGESAKTENGSSTAMTGSSQLAPRSPAEIKGLQRTLKEFGYRPGPVDGILGSQTRWAIKRLQEEHRLKKTGWLDKQTLAALGNPKKYSGTYDEAPVSDKAGSKTAVAERPNTRAEEASRALGRQWFVRGVTPTTAVVYRPDGLSFVAKVGTEIPGMGQVTQLDPEKLHVITANGVITKR